MKVFDEITLEEVQYPDLSVGYLYDGVSPDFGDGREPCQYYHKYEYEELNAMDKGDNEKKIAALEDELKAAKIMLGVE